MPGPGQGIYNMLWTVFTEPLFTGLMSAIFTEYRQPPRPDHLEDESVGSFLERRLGGPDIGNNIASAVLHGIYGGDIYKLSARSLLQTPWLAEKSHGSLSAYSMGLSRNMPMVLAKDLALATELRPKIDEKLSESMQSTSVFTFRDGIEVLVKALEEDLRSKPNVHIRLNDSIKKIEYDDQADNIKVFALQAKKTQLLTADLNRSLQARTRLQNHSRQLYQHFLQQISQKFLLLHYRLWLRKKPSQ